VEGREEMQGSRCRQRSDRRRRGWREWEGSFVGFGAMDAPGADVLRQLPQHSTNIRTLDLSSCRTLFLPPSFLIFRFSIENLSFMLILAAAQL